MLGLGVENLAHVQLVVGTFEREGDFVLLLSTLSKNREGGGWVRELYIFLYRGK